MSLAGKNSCYISMFSNCSSLTQAPELPAIYIGEWCYSSMFEGCTSLTQAPELPVKILKDNCYNKMFYNCTELNYIKVGFKKWSPSSATYNWLPENTGTFECPYELIDNTYTYTTDTVPSSWRMVAV